MFYLVEVALVMSHSLCSNPSDVHWLILAMRLTAYFPSKIE